MTREQELTMTWLNEFGMSNVPAVNILDSMWGKFMIKLSQAELIAVIKRVATKFRRGEVENLQQYFTAAVDHEAERLNKPANKQFPSGDAEDDKPEGALSEP